MSIRINMAKNVKGKAYVAADELDSLIKSMTLAGATVTGTADVWKIQFTTADGSAPETTAVDLTGIKEYIDNKAINVVAGAGIAVDSSNKLSPVIAADVDGSTIILSGTGNTAKLASGLTIVKLNTATTGKAASYELHDAKGQKIGDTIDIDKDRLVISAEHSENKDEKDENGKYIRRERSYGSFTRSFDISAVNAAAISAKYENGVLTLDMPKKSPEQEGARRLLIQ